jgi:hypothetical protein
MISLIPPVIGLTLLLIMSVGQDRDRADASVSDELARDLLRHHEHRFKAAADEGFPIGPVSHPVPPPFEKLADWRSEIVDTGSGRVLITWAEGYGSDGFAPDAYRGVVSARIRPAPSYDAFGLIEAADGGSVRVGSETFLSPSPPFPEGAPAALSFGG